MQKHLSSLRGAAAGALAASALFAGGAIAQTGGHGDQSGGNGQNDQGQQSQGGQTQGGQGQSGQNQGGGTQRASVSALIDAPGRFFGRQVTTAGVVSKVYGPRTFALRGEDAIQRGASGPNEIAVTVTGPLPDVPGRNDNNRLRVGDPVQVMGNFQNYVPIDGDGLQSSKRSVGYQGVPMLVAPQISIAGASTARSDNAGANRSGAQGNSGSGANNGNGNGNTSSNTAAEQSGSANNGGGNVLDPSALTETPTQFLGQQVTVAGVVDKITGPRTLTVRGDDAIQRGASGPNRIRVVLATAVPDVPGRNDNNRLKPGDPIQVSGTFRNLIAIHSRGVASNGRGVRVGYQGAPTVIAQNIGIARMTGNGNGNGSGNGGNNNNSNGGNGGSNAG
jgi:hypothetical protein